MMTDTEKLLLFGLVGLIAWELWPKQPQAAQGGLVANDPLGNIPAWVQQLSAAEQQEYLTELHEGDVITSLLSIPQGPGGTSNYSMTNVQPINFFNPTRGIFGMCDQSANTTMVRPSTWSLA